MGSIWGGVDPNEEFEVWDHTLDEVQARWKFRSHMGSKIRMRIRMRRLW